MGGAKVTDPGSWNKYAYTGGDPINRIDRHGNDYEDCDAGDCVLTWTSDAVGYEEQESLFEQDPNTPCYGTDPSDPACGGFLASMFPGVATFQPQAAQTDGSGKGDITVSGFVAGNGNDRIGTVLQEIMNGLAGNSGCANWLGGGAVPLIQTLLANPTLYGTGYFNNATDYAIIGNTNPDGTPTGVPDGTLITVNLGGAFLAAFSNGQQLPAVGGQYNPGTPAAQAAILIHELAHQLMPAGFQNDFRDQAAVNSNDALVSKNCGKLIGSIK
jgi:hypothetical protein